MEKLTHGKPRRVGDGTPGPGRPKGVPNRTTTQLKEAILAAAGRHGEDGTGTHGLEGYLFRLASDEPRAFAGLLGKVLPLQVVGDEGAPLVTRVEWHIVRPDG
jgi:hypothetical protein